MPSILRRGTVTILCSWKLDGVSCNGRKAVKKYRTKRIWLCRSAENSTIHMSQVILTSVHRFASFALSFFFHSLWLFFSFPIAHTRFVSFSFYGYRNSILARANSLTSTRSRSAFKTSLRNTVHQAPYISSSMTIAKM